ncbi:hypothetical protein [Microbulbifer sediminum]|uniref:hypothetical protein n=1 Tax=Microbulbifer sediminum TaxID=2904250 RepID=UPI001F21BB07|nr:hypothetical protein [Microbulbifer sediminum]
MRYKTVEDVIQEGKEFHKKLARQYGEYEQLAGDSRVVLLLDQLKRREDAMTHTLEEFLTDVSPGALRTWVQFAPEGKEPEFLQRLRQIDLHDADGIAKLALDIDMYLADQYRDLLDDADTPSAKDAFQRLLELEELDEHHLSMNLYNLRDY